MKTFEILKDLTELVAAHGVYALTVIFIFYMWRRSDRDLQSAKTEPEKKFLRKVYISVIVATYAAMAISTGVWIYANFIYKYQHVVRGIITELDDQQVTPKSASDPAKIVQSITPERSDLPFYCYRHENLTVNKYEMLWALLPDREMSAIVFKFQQQFAAIKSRSQQRPGVSSSSAESPFPFGESIDKPSAKTIDGTFKVDLLTALRDPLGAIQLVYKRNSSKPDELGTMCLRDPTNGNLDTLKWLDTSKSESPFTYAEGKQQRLIANFLGFASFGEKAAERADVSQDSTFGINGEYDQRMGNALRQRLGGMDLRTQYEAVELLVGNGKRSFRFIEDCLSDTINTSYDKDLLIHHLSEAVKRIEANGDSLPKNAHLKFALEFYKLGDFQSSAFHFVAAGDKPLTDTEDFFLRGYAYGQAGHYNEAVRSYQEFIRRSSGKYAIAVAQTNLGVIYERKGQLDLAIQSYEGAIETDPEYSRCFNALATLYASHNRNLSVALALVGKALQLEPKSASYVATKAFVLSRMNRRSEAIESNKYAIKLDPDYATALNNLAYLYADEGIKLDTAMALVDRALKTVPDDGHLLDTKGWIYYKKGDYRLAQQFLEEADSRVPKNEEIMNHLKAAKEAALKSRDSKK
jgi:tetratricopeptide (TPR) repeat protein